MNQCLGELQQGKFEHRRRACCHSLRIDATIIQRTVGRVSVLSTWRLKQITLDRICKDRGRSGTHDHAQNSHICSWGWGLRIFWHSRGKNKFMSIWLYLLSSLWAKCESAKDSSYMSPKRGTFVPVYVWIRTVLIMTSVAFYIFASIAHGCIKGIYYFVTRLLSLTNTTILHSLNLFVICTRHFPDILLCIITVLADWPHNDSAADSLLSRQVSQMVVILRSSSLCQVIEKMSARSIFNARQGYGLSLIHI